MPVLTYAIRGGDYEHGGAASRALKEQLKQVGADPAVVRRAMIAAYEAEMNVVIHAQGGELRAALDNGQLDVEVTDSGPGIADVERALRPGFSTADAKARELGFGAGMGLPNIRKHADRFAIESQVGRGTSVRFTIGLRPQALYGAGRNSLSVRPERCRQSLRCLHACPTRAIRVLHGRPEVLDYLCVDCTACIAACPSGTLTVQGTTDALATEKDAVLVVPPAAVAQFGARVAVAAVVDALQQLAPAGVLVTDEWDSVLRNAVIELAAQQPPALPLISPACPAVVNLIETRFPALIPNVAPLLSATQAIRAELGERPATFVVLCPCQKTAVLAGGGGRCAAVLPAALRSAVQPLLGNQNPERSDGPPAHGRRSTPAHARHGRGSDDGAALVTEPLVVTGLRHVLALLGAIEDGLAGDLRVVEPWICDEGCFGSPLLTEDAFLARRRWDEARRRAQRPDAMAAVLGDARAVQRAGPPAPRAGLRLDADMSKAIQKLARIDRLARSLPGADCGMCGAPSCAALAEDIVLGRAAADACVRQTAPPRHEKENETQRHEGTKKTESGAGGCA